MIRATEDDLLRVDFRNASAHPHTIHFHGIHPANMDGVFEIVNPGGSFTYEFPARPYGMHLYHCHATPLKKHIHKGLYGAFIIDPPEPRPPAQELVMVMNAFDTDGDGENNFYAVNGPAFYYARYPIKVKRSQTVRIYLANLTEFDLINSFHLHGDFFRYYPTGTSDQFEYTDTVMLCQGQRGIIEIDFANTRPVHVPRAPVGVRRARLDGLLRGRGLAAVEANSATEERGRSTEPARWRLWALVPIVLLVAVVSLFAARGDVAARARRREPAGGRRFRRSPGRVLAGRDPDPGHEPPARRPDDRHGHGRRRDRALHARRPGHPRTASLLDDRRPLRLGRGRADQRRNHQLDGHPDDGGDRGRGRDAAARTRRASSATRSSAALVGIVPIALGLLWLPSLRRARPEWLAAFMALTGGLLTFLAVEALTEALELQAVLPSALGGTGLVLLGVAASYLALTFLSQRLGRAGAAKGGTLGGLALATLVAIGIGVHNLGEGLAVGTSFALGELTLGTFLIVGFMLHNVTEGLGIAAPAAEGGRAGLGRLAVLTARRRGADDPRRLDRRLRDERRARRRLLRARGRRGAPGRRRGRTLRGAAGAGRPHIGLRGRRLPRGAGDHVPHRPARRVGSGV